MLKIGVLGFGYWGPNLVRNFASAEGATVTRICDINPAARKRAQSVFPFVECVADPEAVILAPDIDAVAVATPVSTHFDIAHAALQAGKHIFVEKPFTSTTQQAQTLIEIAERKGLTIMVDHTFIYTGAVRKIRELLSQEELGELYYYDATRINLGLFQEDINVIWDLAPHDFSILDYLVPNKPCGVSAIGIDHFGRNLENIAFVTIFFEDRFIAHFNLNWLSPVKIRTTLIGGRKKLLLWDDMQTHEKIKIYNSGVDVIRTEETYEHLIQYRMGDMWSPKIEATEALKVETQAFVECVEKGTQPINDGRSGLRVIRLLESTEHSLQNGGVQVSL